MKATVKEIECVITGKVQGVNFRNFIKTHADERGIVGTVENMPDGSVEVIAQGDEAALNELVEHIKKGPYFADVDHVEVTWHTTRQDTFTDFSIVR